MELLRSPWASSFDALLNCARTSLVLCSPFVGREPCRRIAERCRREADGEAPTILLLTDLSRDNLVSGATDAEAIADLCSQVPSSEVRFLPSLHAKVYVADTTCAVVTSANMTLAGLSRNLEYGLRITERSTVEQVRSDISAYASLGSTVSTVQLQRLAQIATDLREMRLAADRSVRARIRREFQRRLEHAETEVLRVRAAGRSAHAIFADAVLFLLRRGPASTKQLHSAVQAIHPDLCNDAVDRVIDGKNFGKKWKHAVRTAQQHLKKSGMVRYDGRMWSLSSDR